MVLVFQKHCFVHGGVGLLAKIFTVVPEVREVSLVPFVRIGFCLTLSCWGRGRCVRLEQGEGGEVRGGEGDGGRGRGGEGV